MHENFSAAVISGGRFPQKNSLFAQWVAERPRRNYQLAIAHLQNPQELLGCCGLRREGHGSDTAELGIELAPLFFWGKIPPEITATVLGTLRLRD